MKDIALILHFIGLAMGLGTSFAFMFLGIASAKMSKKEALAFQLKVLSLSRMGQIGLVLLLFSGLFLMQPYWAILPNSPLLITKLLLVLVLVFLIGIITTIGGKAKREESEKHLERLGLWGRFSLLTTLLIVIMAVLFFH